MSVATIRLARRPQSVRLASGTLAEFERAARDEREAAIHAAGHAAGYAEATQTSAQALSAATSALEELRSEMTDSLAETSAKLAIEMLQALLRVELVAQNYNIIDIVRSTITEAGGTPGAMVIRANPDDAARLVDVPFRSGTTVEADPAVRRGDVELHTQQGLLVRDMDACAASIRERILAEVKSC